MADSRPASGRPRRPEGIKRLKLRESTYNLWIERKEALGLHDITDDDFAEILLYQQLTRERDRSERSLEGNPHSDAETVSEVESVNAPDSWDSFDDPGPRDTSKGASYVTKKRHSLNVHAKPFVPNKPFIPNVNALEFVPQAANVAPSTNGDAKPEISEQDQQVQEDIHYMPCSVLTGANLQQRVDPAQSQRSSGNSVLGYTSIEELSRADDGLLREPPPERYEVNECRSNMADTDKGQCGIVCGCAKKIQALNDEIQQLREVNGKLKEANRKAQEDKMVLESKMNVFGESFYIRGVNSARNPDRSAEKLEYLNALLYLGQMSSDIQTNMYRFVHPSLVCENKSYLFDDIKKDIQKIGDERLKENAKGRWSGLMKTLNWDDRVHTQKAISLYTTRNKTCHPLVSEERLREALAVWIRVNGRNGVETIKELIETWKTMTN